MASSSTPAFAPPEGQLPNFDNPPSIEWQNTLAMSIYIAVVTLFVLARLYTRVCIQKSVWWDDAAQVIATAFLYAMAGLSITLTHYGGGRDIWNITKSDYSTYKTIFGNTEIIARFGITFTKLSLLLLYLRYFCPNKTKRGKVFWATWVVILFNILYSLSLILVIKLQCVGKHLKPGEECVNENLVLVMASTINVITDVMILVIPAAAVWVMKMSRRLKIGLLIVFSVGFLGMMSSVARLIYQVPQNDNPNRTIVNTYVTILAVAEQAIGQVAGCMPVLPSLYRHWFGQSQSSQGKSYDSNDSGRGDSAAAPGTVIEHERGYFSEPGYGPIGSSTVQRIDPSMHTHGTGLPESIVADRYRHFRQHSTKVHGDRGSFDDEPHARLHKMPATRPNAIGVAKTVTVDVSSSRDERSN